MTRGQLLARIFAIRAKMETHVWVKRWVYDPAVGEILWDQFNVPKSLRYDELPLVGPNGFRFAQEKGLSFYVRTRSRPGVWISEQENPDTPAPAKAPQVIERWMGMESIEAAKALMDSHILREEDREYDPETAFQSEEEYLLNQEQMLSSEELTLFEAKYGFEPTIEDPDTGELRPIRVGDVFQIVAKSRRNEELEDLNILYGEEPKDPRYDPREEDWKRQQRPSGLEARLINEGRRFPVKPVARKAKPGQKVKRFTENPDSTRHKVDAENEAKMKARG